MDLHRRLDELGAFRDYGFPYPGAAPDKQVSARVMQPQMQSVAITQGFDVVILGVAQLRAILADYETVMPEQVALQNELRALVGE